jgi:hypothetical protein
MFSSATRFKNRSGAMDMSTRAFLILAVAALWTMAAYGQTVSKGGDGRRFYPDDPLWNDPDTMSIPDVADFELRKDADFLINSFVHPGGDAGPALNVNSVGEVPDSSWFTNRIGLGNMTVQDIVRGPDTVDGPAPGVWTVVSRPAGGITPKFTIRDARGDRYIFKLDPVDLPELPSSVEVISTKIFHALGYNVPEDFVFYVDRARLTVDPNAEWTDERGARRPITENDLKHWLGKMARVRPDGTVRVLASRYIKGKPIGEYQYHETRSDDPNDIFPHEKRRELRGLRVFAAWVHHDDSRSLNTFDTFVEQDGRRFIKHYLLDFGSNMGSGSTSVQEPRAGYEYYAEGDKLLKGIFSFGLWTRDWMHVKYPSYPAVGNYEGEFFEPWKWKPEYPNPSFDRMDEADAFWGANLLTYFTDDVIRAMVATGKISDPAAAAYLAETLIKRRDKCIRYWIRQTNPLDRFKVNGDGSEVTFDNAALRAGAAQGPATYKVQWSALDNLKNEERPVGEEVALTEPRLAVPQQAWGPKDDANIRYAVARIRTFQADNPNWQEPVVLTIRDQGGKYDVVGLQRTRHDPKIETRTAKPKPDSPAPLSTNKQATATGRASLTNEN